MFKFGFSFICVLTLSHLVSQGVRAEFDNLVDNDDEGYEKLIAVFSKHKGPKFKLKDLATYHTGYCVQDGKEGRFAGVLRAESNSFALQYETDFAQDAYDKYSAKKLAKLRWDDLGKKDAISDEEGEKGKVWEVSFPIDDGFQVTTQIKKYADGVLVSYIVGKFSIGTSRSLKVVCHLDRAVGVGGGDTDDDQDGGDNALEIRIKVPSGAKYQQMRDKLWSPGQGFSINGKMVRYLEFENKGKHDFDFQFSGSTGKDRSSIRRFQSEAVTLKVGKKLRFFLDEKEESVVRVYSAVWVKVWQAAPHDGQSIDLEVRAFDR